MQKSCKLVKINISKLKVIYQTYKHDFLKCKVEISKTLESTIE